LNCNAFNVSFLELKCFLPDDPIKLTVIANHTTAATWHKILYDRLMIDSEQLEQGQEQIRDVRMTNDATTFKVLGTINSLPFEIVANNRLDLCMLAFFEEVNALVGNDHLFKRSILLIRAWWTYESGRLSGEESLKEYLPEMAVWLMVAAIFNDHHCLIASPIQALYLFLAIYSNYDGTHQAITLFGIRQFLPKSNNIGLSVEIGLPWSSLSPPYTLSSVGIGGGCDMLISAKLFEKYYQVVNVQSANAMVELMTQKVVKVADRSGFNVVHPFTFSSMTLEKLSSRKSEMILQCFKTAAMDMKNIFQDENFHGSWSEIVFQNAIVEVGQYAHKLDVYTADMDHLLEDHCT
jgi:hypothetical protein